MGDTYPRIRVGAVQAAQVFLDREGSLSKAVDFIEKAGRDGIDLLAFPEGFIPAHLHSVEGPETAAPDEVKDTDKIVDELSASQALATLNRFVQKACRDDAQQEDP